MIRNNTGWSCAEVTDWDPQRRMCQVLTIKQSYEFTADGDVLPLGSSAPVCSQDLYCDSAGVSSLKLATETVPFKSGFEIYGQVTAFPPPDREVRILEVALRFGQQDTPMLLDKVLYVMGQRHWQSSWFGRLFGCAMSEPAPLAATAIAYEQAFGGSLFDRVCLDNPVGRGYRLRQHRAAGETLPSLELAGDTTRRPGQDIRVAGFGPVPRHWRPRLGRQPEIEDAAMLAGKCPYRSPVDAKAYNAAPDDQQLVLDFAPGYWFELVGLMPDRSYGQPTRIALPYELPALSVVLRGQPVVCSPQCDTLVIDGTAQCFHLIWRARQVIDSPDTMLCWHLAASDHCDSVDD